MNEWPKKGNNSFIFFHRGNNNIIPYGSLPDKGSFLLIFCKNSDQKRQKTRKNRENRPFSVFGKVARFYSELSVEIASKADFPSLEIVDVYVSTVGMGSNSISISTDGYFSRSVDRTVFQRSQNFSKFRKRYKVAFFDIFWTILRTLRPRRE